MRIIFIDTAVDGHHIIYLRHLMSVVDGEAMAILPEKIPDLTCEQYIYTSIDMNRKPFLEFLRWEREVAKIVEKFMPDIIHVVTVDSYLKYFGLGINRLRKICPVVTTLHWCREGVLKSLSRNLISRFCDKVVVHSEYLLNYIKKEGIRNGVCINYPQFTRNDLSNFEAKKKLNIDLNIPVISAIGNTREDKGLDILLEALARVKKPFRLLIAGKIDSFNEEFIEKKIISYKDKVILMLKYLTDEEYKYAIAASDIIVLPYRKLFNGASGPLVEGAFLGKCIIGSSHGNLGDTIDRNHLGYTFETENVIDLSEKIEMALINYRIVDEIYLHFQNKLAPELFCDNYFQLYLSIKKG